MRTLLLVVCLAAAICRAWPQSALTVVQIEHSLVSANRHKVSDADMATWLSSIQLDEQLDNYALKRILGEVKLGPQSLDALTLLAAESAIEETPRSEWIASSPPSLDDQHKMIEQISEYSQNTLAHLPDFLALRTTRTFANSPVQQGRGHLKPVVRLHFMSELHNQIAYRNGRESLADSTPEGESRPLESKESFQSWGEFGPVLRTLLSDAVRGSLQWSHWEHGTGDHSNAVFSYAVPRAASHYLVDYCCYQTSENSGWERFNQMPAYRGRIYFDPLSRSLSAITLSAEFGADTQMIKSGLAVQYGSVDIGGRSYVCPTSSVVVSFVHSFALQSLDGVGLEKHVNLVTFRDYHKFGTESRILP
ncbi:MAG TPA: hypothetical protein VKB38_20295 [Terracidiphilus sp.]|nr:hypothetical protein [Terracidiphilus sp.]